MVVRHSHFPINISPILPSFFASISENDEHNCAAVIDSSPTVNSEPSAQLQGRES